MAKKAAAAGTAFEQAVSLSEQGKQKEAQAAFDKLAADAPTGYRTLASFRAAAGLVKEQPAEAVKAYDKLATDPTVGPTMQDLAAVRAGMLQVDTVPFDQLKRKLEPATEAGRPFRATARELLALSAWRNHDYDQARHYIDLIVARSGDVAGHAQPHRSALGADRRHRQAEREAQDAGRQTRHQDRRQEQELRT